MPKFMTQSMISDTITPLDKAYQTLVKSSRSEVDLLNYHQSLLKTTLYVPVVNVTGGADMQVIKKDLPLYAKRCNKPLLILRTILHQRLC